MAKSVFLSLKCFFSPGFQLMPVCSLFPAPSFCLQQAEKHLKEGK